MTVVSDVLASDSVHAIWLVQMDAIRPCYLVKTFRECFEKNVQNIDVSGVSDMTKMYDKAFLAKMVRFKLLNFLEKLHYRCLTGSSILYR